MNTTEHFDVMIVVAGISGIGAAHHLKEQCPGKSFVLLESKATHGGTWETLASGDTSNLQILAGTPLLIGESPDPGQAAGFYGRIDEIRISGVSRSDDWIRAQHLSMNDAFISFTDDPQACP